MTSRGRERAGGLARVCGSRENALFRLSSSAMMIRRIGGCDRTKVLLPLTIGTSNRACISGKVPMRDGSHGAVLWQKSRNCSQQLAA
eukprot:scaffold1169_cov245-Pinguiococcus_pyrenoidosus.AAC.8